MKIYQVIIMCALVSPVAFAKPKGLSDAFKQAISQSEAEKTKSKISLEIDKSTRLSAWKGRGNGPLVLKVDSEIIQETSVTVLRPSPQLNFDSAAESQKAIEQELIELQ